jgi:hypothetical protein
MPAAVAERDDIDQMQIEPQPFGSTSKLQAI